MPIRTHSESRRADRVVLALMVVYGIASLVHFAHNAAYLSDYPHMPAWLTPGGVWAAWGIQTAIGGVGYYVYRRASRDIGAAIIALYGVLGFAGLDHYWRAPMGAHSGVMNVTILGECAAAAALLVAVAWAMRTRAHELQSV